MEQALFVRFLENMITLCQSTLEEMKEKEPVAVVPVRKKTFNIETIDTPMMNGKRSWFAWRSVQDGRGTRVFTRIYNSDIKGISELTEFGWWATAMLSAYKIYVGGHGARSTFDMDAFRTDYESGYVHVLTSDESLPRERPLNRQSSLIDMVVDEPIGCEPVPESDNKELRFQALSEQLLAAVLRRDQVGIGDYRNLARETGSNMAEIRQTLDRLASEPLNLLKRRATAVGPVYTPAD